MPAAEEPPEIPLNIRFVAAPLAFKVTTPLKFVSKPFDRSRAAIVMGKGTPVICGELITLQEKWSRADSTARVATELVTIPYVLATRTRYGPAWVAATGFSVSADVVAPARFVANHCHW